MAVTSDSETVAGRISVVTASATVRPDPKSYRPLAKWGGFAGLIGALLLVASAIVVGAMGLPDASDVETLRDFDNIETGRIIEHFLYLGALMGFALHAFVLYRLLKRSHRPAALFGLVFASFGLIIMAASSLLHVSTAPLADLYREAAGSPDDQRAIEFAWHAAQSVFDTMLATGVLLVPIGIVLFGYAMWRSAAFGRFYGGVALVLGLLGIVGAVVGVVDPGSLALAGGVGAMVFFHLIAGWRTMKAGLPKTCLIVTRSTA